MLKNKKYGGFTLLEMLVVVLIIGILAGIALPQYQMAVTKAKVASILPLMRRWYDGMAEYKLRTGSYFTEDDENPDGSLVGANWQSDWINLDEDTPCGDYFACGDGIWECGINYGDDGSIGCTYESKFVIIMSQSDSHDYCGGNQGKTICMPFNGSSVEGEKICKSLGKPSGKFDDRQCTVIGG